MTNIDLLKCIADQYLSQIVSYCVHILVDVSFNSKRRQQRMELN